MRLSSAQKSIAASWAALAAGLCLAAFVSQYAGYAVMLGAIVFFRMPYINEAKSFAGFLRAWPKSAYGLAALAALSACGILAGALMGYGTVPDKIGNPWVDEYMWVPIGLFALLLVAHEAWLFPTLRDTPGVRNGI